MKKNNLNKNLRVIWLILSIICMLIFVINKVSAESMDSNLQAEVLSFMDENIRDYPENVVSEAMTHCPYVRCYKAIANGYEIYVAEFFSIQEVGATYMNAYGNFFYGKSNPSVSTEYFDGNYSYFWRACICYKGGTTLPTNEIYYYRITSGLDNKLYYGACKAYTNRLHMVHYTTSAYNGVDEYLLCIPENDGWTFYGDSNSRSNYISQTEYISYGNIYKQNNASGYTWSLVDDTFSPVTYNPDFNIYLTYGLGGIDDPILNIEYNNPLVDLGYLYTSRTQYDLSLIIDDTSYNISVNSNDYPDYFYDNGYRLPYSFIYSLITDQLFEFSGTESVVLDMVSMNYTCYPDQQHLGVPQTASASTTCYVLLNGRVLDSVDYDSTDYDNVMNTQTVFSQVSASSDFVNSTGFYNSNVNIPVWADVFTIIIYYDHGYIIPSSPPYNCNWWVSAEDFFNLISGSGGGTIDNSVIPGSDYDIDIDYSFDLWLNKSGTILDQLLKYNDVVRLVFGEYESDNNQIVFTTIDDFMFFTYNYYLKLNIKAIGNVQYAIESLSEVTLGFFNMTYQYLDHIDYTLENRLSSFDKLLGSLNTYNLSINNTLNDIKDKLDNLNISGGLSSAQLSSTLISLFMPTLSWESIDFDDYMESMGVLALPFELTNDVLTVTDGAYSSTLDLHINNYDVPIGEDTFHIFDSQDYSFNPRSLFTNQAWTLLQYLNLFAVIVGESWFTYCHIFRREKVNDC